MSVHTSMTIDAFGNAPKVEIGTGGGHAWLRVEFTGAPDLSVRQGFYDDPNGEITVHLRHVGDLRALRDSCDAVLAELVKAEGGAS